MLQYLIKHESELLESLSHFRTAGSGAVSPPLTALCASHLDEAADALNAGFPAAEEVQMITLNLYGCLIAELEQEIEKAGAPAILHDLAGKERMELKRLARNFDFQEDI